MIAGCSQKLAGLDTTFRFGGIAVVAEGFDDQAVVGGQAQEDFAGPGVMAALDGKALDDGVAVAVVFIAVPEIPLQQIVRDLGYPGAASNHAKMLKASSNDQMLNPIYYLVNIGLPVMWIV